ncbi:MULTISPECIES: NAD-dependent epimerase/dehydratase family protein [Streptomyces]|uniref:NAD-dependent epimerase/dehydratase family protein n=1 Tax=Streptomyces TaxID=1883 RepID=UPI000D1C6919|nr:MULTISPECIES: NAD-dependent epimerase/dehydratase family protein [unclassified Streptomyces]WTE31007.1 NAD-dependent epimerase/dehydratase family protein [Streptomyces anulatus]
MKAPVLIAGSSGTNGTRLATELDAHGIPLRLLDYRPPTGAEFIHAELRDASAVAKAVEGAVAVIHLAGITEEALFAEVVEHNITATHLPLEAARRQIVPRGVASGFRQLRPTLIRSGEPTEPLPDAGKRGQLKSFFWAIGMNFLRRQTLPLAYAETRKMVASSATPRSFTD